MSLIELPIVSTEESQPARARKPEWLRSSYPLVKIIKEFDSWLMNTSCTPFARAAMSQYGRMLGAGTATLWFWEMYALDHVRMQSKREDHWIWYRRTSRVAEAIRLMRVKLMQLLLQLIRMSSKIKELKSGTNRFLVKQQSPETTIENLDSGYLNPTGKPLERMISAGQEVVSTIWRPWAGLPTGETSGQKYERVLSK